MPTLITLKDVAKTFEVDNGRLPVLQDINLQIKEGEFLILLGPSGSGKSTLLRMLAGLIPVTSGSIVRKRRLRQAFIFQEFALFPWLTVFENIEFGLKMKNITKVERHHKVRQLVKEMGLEGFENSYPRELSGGMKQRVGIARALSIDPEIIFLDEPFSALDSFTARKLREEVLNIFMDKKITMVMVTHLIEEALLLGDRIAIIRDRPATIVSTVHNKLGRPRNVRSAEFFKLSDRIAKTIAL